MIGTTELIILILPVIIIAVVIYRVRKRNKRKVIVKDEHLQDVSTIKNEQNTHSLKILKERLAKGEITKKEYDELKGEFE